VPGRFIDEWEHHVLLDVPNSEIALSQLWIKKNRQQKNILCIFSAWWLNFLSLPYGTSFDMAVQKD
jgi:hypothetical protein